MKIAYLIIYKYSLTQNQNYIYYICNVIGEHSYLAYSMRPQALSPAHQSFAGN